MVVFIVLRNNEVDEVFSSFESALEHQSNLTKKWALTYIVEKEVKEL